MTFLIKVFLFDRLQEFTLPFEGAKEAIAYFSKFECIEQIWVLNYETNTLQAQISYED